MISFRYGSHLIDMGISRIELFCRDAPEGWDTWGDETGKFDSTTLEPHFGLDNPT